MAQKYTPKYSIGDWVYYQNHLWQIESISETDFGPTYCFSSSQANYISTAVCEEADPYIHKS